MSAPEPMPVVVVGGLHADARRATVERLLHEVPDSVALLHDLSAGPAGEVRRSVRDATGELSRGETPLVNDCACCALREDLVPELERLAESGLTRLAVVELWDSVEPRGMAEVVAADGAGLFRLTNVVTAVDPSLVLACLSNSDDLSDTGLAAAPTDRRTVADTFARQLEYAPVLAVADSPGTGLDDLALLRQLHPTAVQIPIGSGTWAAAAVAGFDVNAAATAQHPACARLPHDCHEHGVSTLVWQRRRPFHSGRLYEALEDLCCAAARSRGRFWLADRPDSLLAWDAAGGALCVESAGPWMAALPDAAWELMPAERRTAAALDWHPEHGDRCQHLVFTSPGLDRDGLVSLLESCLLTDAELAAGPQDLPRPTGFDELLDFAA
ncbi:GTP-binding protein [Streptomyces sp. VRA16 Mangrove soil]|uniref:CobW family GTP-binding protein n=1 Tax=Streptomyces sp. VRA16 Mangrove soil TaxID=2817434 RepID=UPI001A9E84FB|nr:GTP-binding protein [Streptomyces sp. VRA16 Mangrove soil]MBO1332760.1 GTP-binding protein [Streptomyces sp. VRA16 Mangrove soil]